MKRINLNKFELEHFGLSKKELLEFIAVHTELFCVKKRLENITTKLTKKGTIGIASIVLLNYMVHELINEKQNKRKKI